MWVRWRLGGMVMPMVMVSLVVMMAVVMMHVWSRVNVHVIRRSRRSGAPTAWWLRDTAALHPFYVRKKMCGNHG